MNDAPAAEVSAVPAAPSSDAAARDARDLGHFRRATIVVGALMAAFVAMGLVAGMPALFEIGVAFLGFTLFLRAGLELWPAARTKLLTLHPRRFFLETWKELDAESDAARAEDRAAGRWDPRPLVALVTGAVCLVSMEYFGHGEHFDRLLTWIEPHRAFEDPTTWAGRLRESEWIELAEFAYWSFWRVLGYLVVPLVVVKIGLRQRIRDQGLETKGLSEHAWIYALGYLVVFLCVVLVARHDEAFRTYYPFYREAGRSWLDFGAWELLYAAQFFSLEIFFRGFWLKQMGRALGSQAIFAMMVPYCMIHIGKPFPETIAAIVAGIFLGTLAMKTRSIWSGFLIHVSVAVSMDVAALLATTGIPDRLVPW